MGRVDLISLIVLVSSILLLGWAAGGILFGQVADRLGRTRTLMLTMLLYALVQRRASKWMR